MLNKEQVFSEFDAAYKKGREDAENGKSPLPPPGEFSDVLVTIVEWLKRLGYVDASIKAGAGSDVWRLVVWPSFRPAESMTLITVWIHKNTASVLGQGDTKFTDPGDFLKYFQDLIANRFGESLKEIENRFNGDADGMLRVSSPGRMTMDDVSVIIPRKDFLLLAQASADDTIKIKIDATHNKRFNTATQYKYLTSAGHVLEIDDQGVFVEDGITYVTGRRKPSAEKLAA